MRMMPTAADKARFVAEIRQALPLFPTSIQEYVSPLLLIIEDLGDEHLDRYRVVNATDGPTELWMRYYARLGRRTGNGPRLPEPLPYRAVMALCSVIQDLMTDNDTETVEWDMSHFRRHVAELKTYRMPDRFLKEGWTK